MLYKILDNCRHWNWWGSDVFDKNILSLMNLSFALLLNYNNAQHILFIQKCWLIDKLRLKKVIWVRLNLNFLSADTGNVFKLFWQLLKNSHVVLMHIFNFQTKKYFHIPSFSLIGLKTWNLEQKMQKFWRFWHLKTCQTWNGMNTTL